MEWIFDPQIWVSLVTLTALEIILGIDNIVVISILSHKLPQPQQKKARSVGISLALINRILLLLSIVWLASLTTPLFTVWTNKISTRDLIMIGGGLFLLVKGTREIHHVFEKDENDNVLKLMLVASGAISTFIHKHPSLKMLALSFLLMVGVTLIAEGLEFHIPKGYIYFAMGFSGMVETLNLLSGNRKRAAKASNW
jgi:predicted tellurium resistance membrane protein TerC